MKKITLIFIMFTMLVACSASKNLNTETFSKSERDLILSAIENQPMRVYKITNHSDSLLLRRQSAYIKPDPNDIVQQAFVKRLFATVRDSISLGVGIAAPQVGVLKNIIWVQRFDKDDFPFEVYFNPQITAYSDKTQTFREGCLSIPNRSDTLYNRAYSINLKYDTFYGLEKTETVEGFTSVIFQHEIDHLNGILYLDHLNKDIKDSEN